MPKKSKTLLRFEKCETFIRYESYSVLDAISILPPGHYEAELRPVAKKKTADQLGYFWGVVVLAYSDYLIEATGDFRWGSRQHTYERFIAPLFLSTDILHPTNAGEVIGSEIQGVSELNKEYLAVLITRCIEYAAVHFGFDIPPPDKEWKNKK